AVFGVARVPRHRSQHTAGGNDGVEHAAVGADRQGAGLEDRRDDAGAVVGDGKGVAQAVESRTEGGVAPFELLPLLADAGQHLVEGVGQLGQFGVGGRRFHRDVVLAGAHGLGGGRQLAHEARHALVQRHWAPPSAACIAGSSPRAKRTRLPAWRATTRAASPPIPAFSHAGLSRASTTAGVAPITTSDAAEALPVRRAMSSHTTTNGRATTGSRTATVPAAVATPRPPRKRRKTGKTWPRTEAMPQAIASLGPPTLRPIPLAAAPLAASPRKTASPARAPASR